MSDVISLEDSVDRALDGMQGRRRTMSPEDRIRRSYFADRASIESLVESSGLRRHEVVAILRPHDTGDKACSSRPL